MKHTPGPWHINCVNTKLRRIVGDETTTEKWDKMMINNRNCTIAEVYRPADARLIRTATELLATCKHALSFIESLSYESSNTPSTKLQDALLDVIKRAEG